MHQIHAARTGTLSAFIDGLLLNAGDARGNSNDDAWSKDARALTVDLLDEVAKHRFGHCEVANDSILQRANRADGARRLAKHVLRCKADGLAIIQNDVGALADCHHGGLVQYDAFASHAHQGVASAKVNPHINAKEA